MNYIIQDNTCQESPGWGRINEFLQGFITKTSAQVQLGVYLKSIKCHPFGYQNKFKFPCRIKVVKNSHYSNIQQFKPCLNINDIGIILTMPSYLNYCLTKIFLCCF